MVKRGSGERCRPPFLSFTRNREAGQTSRIQTSDKPLPRALFPLVAGDGEKQVGNIRVELGATVFSDLAGDRLEGEGPAIGTVGGHCIQGIHQSEDTGAIGIWIPLSPLGYPVPSKRS